jgi:cytochrome c oxidase subunit 1
MSTSAGEWRQHYLNAGYSVRSWLLTTDHKRIAILYLASITLFFLLGGVLAGLLRLELLTPHGDLVQAETYNKLFTLHGITMIFFFLIPSIPAVLGNFLVPMMIGARDLAFPRLNLASWYVYVLGGSFTIVAAVTGGVDTGWTFYTPYSSTYANTNVILTALGVFITGFSSILTGLNFIVTIHKMRAPGLTWSRLPLFIWAHYATSLIMVLGTPVLAVTILLVALERGLGIGIFDPALGGDPVLFQHLFWFYSHPAVYIMILPSMGVISELIACFARKRIFGYSFVAFSSLAIAVFGFLVWGHHMFVSGMNPYGAIAFSVLTLSIGVPSAVKTFNWLGTIWGGSIRYHPAMLFALGFVSVFVSGGLTGIFLGQTSLDLYLHDTYFVVGHFHMIMGVAAMFGIFAATYYWFPKMFGRLLDARLGRLHFVVTFAGVYLVFAPMLAQGIMGHPRRYYDSTAYGYLAAAQPLHELVTWAAVGTAAAQCLFLANLVWAWARGPVASDNPWEATTLEWTTGSPPPPANFVTEPVVHRGAYAYSVPGAGRDFIVQTDPPDARPTAGGSG